MDDIELNAKNQHDIDSLIQLPRIYRMSLGLDHCGRMVYTQGVERPDVQDSLDIREEDGNK